MAQLTYLEDPPNGQSPVSVMVLDEAIESLKMYCRGGTNCCGKEDTRICVEAEGDCDHDDECEGTLQCGTDNCPVQSGGYWDDKDDCCDCFVLVELINI